MKVEDDARATLSAVAAARQRFLELVAELRPELHRYCARMTGSVFDGEDVLQESLAKAHFALGQLTEPPALKPWLFRIAHNTAMDFHRRYEQKHVDSVAEVPEPTEPEDAGVDPALVEAALSVFVDLPPLQRSALILKDVLGHSLEEVAVTLGTSVGAVKGALTRARANLDPRSSQAARLRSSPEHRRNIQRYVDLFNDQNWDGLRALLAEESRLDLVSRLERRTAEARYYDQYAAILRSEELRAEPGSVDGELAIAIFSPAHSAHPAYFVLLEWGGDLITRIRDFRYVPYIGTDARFTPFTG